MHCSCGRVQKTAETARATTLPYSSTKGWIFTTSSHKTGARQKKIDVKIYDTVINKTPLSYRTNRIIGGVAPSEDLAKLELGKKNKEITQVENPPIPPDTSRPLCGIPLHFANTPSP